MNKNKYNSAVETVCLHAAQAGRRGAGRAQGVVYYRVCGGRSATRSSARAAGAGWTAGRGQQQRNMARACRRGASATDADTGV